VDEVLSWICVEQHTNRTLSGVKSSCVPRPPVVRCWPKAENFRKRLARLSVRGCSSHTIRMDPALKLRTVVSVENDDVPKGGATARVNNQL
jgi:hypothetical protein